MLLPSSLPFPVASGSSPAAQPQLQAVTVAHVYHRLLGASLRASNHHLIVIGPSHLHESSCFPFYRRLWGSEKLRNLSSATQLIQPAHVVVESRPGGQSNLLVDLGPVSWATFSKNLFPFQPDRISVD